MDGRGVDSSQSATFCLSTVWNSDQDPAAAPISHPLSYAFFLGARSNGTFIPSRTLRDFYRVDRVDDEVGGEEEDDDDDNNNNNDGGDGGK